MASPATNVPLAPFTTLRVGGPATLFAEAETPEDLASWTLWAKEHDVPLFVLGGGSNVLIGDEGFEGLVVRMGPMGGPAMQPGARLGRQRVGCGAGVRWDDLVRFCVERGLSGIEALSGIPGCIGSAVMQNLGAYGQEMGGNLVGVRMLDRQDGLVRAYSSEELALGYRSSMLRRSLEDPAQPQWHPTPRWVVLEALFEFDCSDSGTVAHPQLAGALGCDVGTVMPLAQIREAVLGVRASKGMVADPDPEGPAPLYDRWSSGSFFTNPVLAAEEAERVLPEDAPRYAAGAPGLVKTSAAWLIEHAGFPRGWGVHGPDSAATLSSLHTLALTNRGRAAACDVEELARAVRDGVREAFDVVLTPETVLVGSRL